MRNLPAGVRLAAGCTSPDPVIPNVLGRQPPFPPRKTSKDIQQRPSLGSRSPSPTIVEFAVTTAPQNRSTQQLLTYATGLLRQFVTVATLLLGLKYRRSAPFALSPQVRAQIYPILSLPSAATARLSWRYLLPTSAILLYASCFAGCYTDESLLVVWGLGVQISSTSWIGRRRFCGSRFGFIPPSRW